MAKASGDTGGRFSIFQEEPITWMAPEVLMGGGRLPLAPHFLGPCQSRVYHCVWSVVTADSFAPAKRDESFSAMFTEP